MKKIIFLIVIIALFITGLGIYSCQKNEKTDFSKKSVTLKFEMKNNKIKEVISNIKYINKVPKLISEELIEVYAKNKYTGKNTSVFILKETEKSIELSALSKNIIASSESGNCQFKIERGYGYDGRCFVYGTFYIGTNCEQLFVPASVTEYIGFEPVCPDWDGAFAKNNQKNNL